MAELVPKTHKEKVIAKVAGDSNYNHVDAVTHLEKIIKKYGTGGGGGDVSSYDRLIDKPQINGTTLTGNKSLDEIGVTAAINTQVAKLIADAPEDFDTLKEISDWIYSHEDSAAAMNTAIQDNARDIAALNVMLETAENHNGIYRGKNLTSEWVENGKIKEELWEKVNKGDFSDLYLGDYFTVSITTTLPDETVKTENVDLMIAAFDYYYNVGDTALTTHHIVLIPRNQGFATTVKMNDTNTTEGGYLNSYMHQAVLPCYAKSLKTALNNHLLSHRTILPNAINATTPSMAGAGLTGASSGWAWETVELQLMNEVQLYGTMVWSSSAYDVGVDNRKLPVFNFIIPVQFGRLIFWLRSVVSSAHFAYCNISGLAEYGGASGARYVRPLILFG